MLVRRDVGLDLGHGTSSAAAGRARRTASPRSRVGGERLPLPPTPARGSRPPAPRTPARAAALLVRRRPAPAAEPRPGGDHLGPGAAAVRALAPLARGSCTRPARAA